MSSRMLFVLAVTCGVAVGNIYFPQTLVPLIATGLHTSSDEAALAVSATQIGYASGIFLLVPLGDRLPHRRLLLALLGLTGFGLLLAGCARNLSLLVAGSVLIGLTTVGAQVIGPLAAGLVEDQRRAAVLGTLLSGSVGGMILARAFSGTLGEWFGWRVPYLAAAVLVFLLLAVLSRMLPYTSPQSRERYPSLLAESLRLLFTEPELRRSCLYQAAVFAGFSAVWTTLAILLTGPVYGLGTSAVGLFALVGGVTACCTPLAGGWVDRQGPGPVNLVCMFGVLVSAAVLAGGTHGDRSGLIALIIGTLLLDVAMQCGMVANQARVYALRPERRSRLNTAYMTCAYLGGSAGSWIGSHVYDLFGWAGVCGFVVVLTMPALLRHLLTTPARKRGRDRSSAVGDSGACRPPQ
ncbi:putative MFS family arabinose efflux permease [Actinopolyspora lacussalsi]|nr:putative MFS family arabinose efflux permease [Actinopolyspora lacussalsi]